jgi:hypothetical protein
MEPTPIPPGETPVAAASPRGRFSGCDSALVERDPELGRIGVALVARHKEVLRAGRVQRLHEPRLLAADEE